ncbi:hypothetical protein C8Q74DRAFT_651260 [Fomes fomentarius]|nr:hypothetical protein C8Q74DRAFT_651260 [Fomes fomentarius]
MRSYNAIAAPCSPSTGQLLEPASLLTQLGGKTSIYNRPSNFKHRLRGLGTANTSRLYAQNSAFRFNLRSSPSINNLPDPHPELAITLKCQNFKAAIGILRPSRACHTSRIRAPLQVDWARPGAVQHTGEERSWRGTPASFLSLSTCMLHDPAMAPETGNRCRHQVSPGIQHVRKDEVSSRSHCRIEGVMNMCPVIRSTIPCMVLCYTGRALE